MVRLVVFAKVFPGAVKTSFHGCDSRIEGNGDFRMAAALLHEGQQRTVLGAELGEGMAQGVEFLGVNGTGGFGNIFVLFTEGQKDAAKFLPAQLVNAGIAGEAKQPGFELRGSLEPGECPDHFDKDLLAQILHVIAPVGHGVNKAGDAMLIGDNELPLGVFVAFLGSPNKVGQRGR